MSEFVNVLDTPFLREFEERQTSPVEAIPTPLDTWNRLCGDDGGGVGIPPGWLVTVGGNPGYGKSLFGLILGLAALTARLSVGFMSLEMSPEQLAARLYAMATGTNIKDLERGDRFSVERFASVRRELQRIQLDSGMADFFVNRDPLHRVRDLLEHMEALRTMAGVKFFVVDFLQLVGTGDEESIFRQVSEVVNSLRLFVREHKVAVIALSQFNRTTAANYEQSPRCQGLHGGMAIEAASDQVLLFDHSRFERDKVNPYLARTWLVVDKNRHGFQGAIPVEWDHRTLRIREALPDEESQWPGAKR